MDRMSSHAHPSVSGIPLDEPRHDFLVWYRTAVLTIVLGILYTNLPIYAYMFNPALLPKYFFFGANFLLLPLFFLRLKALKTYLVSPFALWAFAFILLNIIHLLNFSADSSGSSVGLVNQQAESQSLQILTRIQYAVFALLLGFAVFIKGPSSYQYIFVALAIVVPFAIVLDFVKPDVLYPINTPGSVLGRAAAMFINPTMAAEAMLLIFVFSCPATPMKYRTVLFLILGAGILTTFTRSAIIAWALLWPLLVMRKVLPRSAIWVTSIALGGFLFFFSMFENYLDTRQDFDGALANVQARLDFFTSASLGDDSAQERAAVVAAGWELFMQNPVFGAGASATQFWAQRGSTHNQLLMLAAEYGCLGIGIWLWLAVILWQGKFFRDRSLQLTIFFLFIFMSMFTHQIFDSATYWLATFALVSVQRTSAALPAEQDHR